MARLFDDASTQYLEVSSAPISAFPCTMACWFRSNDLTALQGLITQTVSTLTTERFGLLLRGDLANDPLQAYHDDDFATVPSTTGATSANTWTHACAVFAANNDFRVYRDGGNKGTSAPGFVSLGAFDRFSIGRFGDSTPSVYMSGDIAEVAIWNVALTDEQVALLAKGVSPLMVQPQDLVFYAPLIGKHASEIDIIGGLSLTVTGATAAAHPRVFYPSTPRAPFHAVAAGGGDPEIALIRGGKLVGGGLLLKGGLVG